MSGSAQIPLALSTPELPSFDNYWHPADGDPRLVLRQFLDRAQGGSLWLQGPPGSGKTHLLLACAAAAAERGALYLSLAQIDAAALSEVEAPLLALDQIDAIASQPDLESALFAVLNRAHDRHGLVLMAARSAPEALPFTLPDLRSRLQWASRLRLAAADDDMRRGILLDRAARRGIPLDGSAIDYLLRHAPREIGALLTLIEALDREALARGRRISLRLVREWLARAAPDSQPHPQGATP